MQAGGHLRSPKREVLRSPDAEGTSSIAIRALSKAIPASFAICQLVLASVVLLKLRHCSTAVRPELPQSGNSLYHYLPSISHGCIMRFICPCSGKSTLRIGQSGRTYFTLLVAIPSEVSSLMTTSEARRVSSSQSVCRSISRAILLQNLKAS